MVKDFAALLTEAIYKTKEVTGKPIAIIQDELGYALGKKGGHIIRKWRGGHGQPKTMSEREALARKLVQINGVGLNRKWLQRFLESMDYAYVTQLCDELFPVVSPLTQIPTDTIPEPGPLPSLSRLPFMPNPLFTGRKQTLQQLAHLLKAAANRVPGPTIVIMGWGGVGKTQLLVEFVHRYGVHFTGGVFWLNCADAEAIPAQVAVCGDKGHMALHPNFDELPQNEQVQLVQKAWREAVPRLLVFDACEEEAILTQWRPPSGGCCVLVTSRRSRWSPVPWCESTFFA